jgi:CTP:molybdopterin cytidylyltransferase MocA
VTAVPSRSQTAGLLLAAGGGRRMGGPKALLHDRDGTSFLHRAVRRLLQAGCAPVVVVLGASADRARALLAEGGLSDPPVRVVVAGDWAEGMGASLRAGLAALAPLPDEVEAALVTLVDLPDVDVPVLRRVLGTGGGAGALVRTTYSGRPGHPVLLGRDHWEGVAAAAHGDAGARGYLTSCGVVACECADLATGRDVDRPGDL